VTRQGYFKRIAIYAAAMTSAWAAITQGPELQSWLRTLGSSLFGLIFLYGIIDLISAGTKRRENTGVQLLVLDQNISVTPGVTIPFISAIAAAAALLAIPFFAVPLIVFQSLSALIGMLICAIVLIPMALPDYPQPS
jgi:hypothetical protein